MKPLLSALAMVLLGGCVATPPPAPAPAIAPAAPLRTTGLERVLGKPAASLVALFGPADGDVREATARKLQFASGICVLDAYLYPPAQGREPVVTHVDARQPDGQAIDRASCVAALTRRQAAQ